MPPKVARVATAARRRAKLRYGLTDELGLVFEETGTAIWPRSWLSLNSPRELRARQYQETQGVIYC